MQRYLIVHYKIEMDFFPWSVVDAHTCRAEDCHDLKASLDYMVRLSQNTKYVSKTKYGFVQTHLT